MALGDTAGVLFKIKADGSQALQEFSAVEAGTAGLSKTNAELLGGLTVLTAAYGAYFSVLAAGTGAVWELAKSTAEFGSAIFDATQKTGAGAQTISALKYAADTSGSSLDSISGSLAKFNVLVGQANQGNEKADATLKRYGITARDTNGALIEAIKVVSELSSADQQAAAAKDLFKDKTGQVLPVIKSFNGDLPGLISHLKELGLVMSDEDAAAADAFGDTLDTLHMQVAALGRSFASEFLPTLTHVMARVSEAMAKNKDDARAWGESIDDAIKGAEIAFNGLQSAAHNGFQALTLGMSSSAAEANFWAITVRAALESVIAPLGVLISLQRLFGQNTAKANIGGTVNIPSPTSVPSSGGKGGGGGAKKDDALQKVKADLEASIRLQEKSLNDLEKKYDEKMKVLGQIFDDIGDKSAYTLGGQQASLEFRDQAANILAQLTELEAKKASLDKLTKNQQLLREKEIQERRDKVADTIYKHDNERIKKVVDADAKAAADRAKIAEDLAEKIKQISEQTSEAIHNDLVKNADAEIEEALRYYTTVLENAKLTKDKRAQIERELAEILGRNYQALTIDETARFENAKIQLDQWKAKAKATIEENVKDEETRRAKLQEVDDEYQRQLDLLTKIHGEETKGIEQKTATPVVANQGPTGAMDQLIQAAHDNLSGTKQTAAVAGLEALRTGFEQLGQAVGQTAAALVLYGTAGTSIRKVTAQILAGITQQAAMKAIFELAEGFAALALAFFGIPNAGPSATAHFTAAAIYGGIAGIAGIAGRKVAGDRFKDATGGGAGAGAGATGNSSNSDPNARQNNFGTTFTGFGKDSGFGQLHETLKQNMLVNAELLDTNRMLATRLQSIPPEHVVQLGADGAATHITDAVIKRLHQDQGATSDMLRNMSLVR